MGGSAGADSLFHGGPHQVLTQRYQWEPSVRGQCNLQDKYGCLCPVIMTFYGVSSLDNCMQVGKPSFGLWTSVSHADGGWVPYPKERLLLLGFSCRVALCNSGCFCMYIMCNASAQPKGQRFELGC